MNDLHERVMNLTPEISTTAGRVAGAVKSSGRGCPFRGHGFRHVVTIP